MPDTTPKHPFIATVENDYNALITKVENLLEHLKFHKSIILGNLSNATVATPGSLPPAVGSPGASSTPTPLPPAQPAPPAPEVPVSENTSETK